MCWPRYWAILWNPNKNINLRFKHYFWVSRFQRKGLPSSALLWCSQSFIEEVDCFLGRSAAYFSWFLNAFTSFILEFMLTCHEYTHKKHETGFNISLSEFIQSFLLSHHMFQERVILQWNNSNYLPLGIQLVVFRHLHY